MHRVTSMMRSFASLKHTPPVFLPAPDLAARELMSPAVERSSSCRARELMRHVSSSRAPMRAHASRLKSPAVERSSSCLTPHVSCLMSPVSSSRAPTRARELMSDVSFILEQSARLHATLPVSASVSVYLFGFEKEEQG
jgi:hypothetical protein